MRFLLVVTVIISAFVVDTFGTTCESGTLLCSNGRQCVQHAYWCDGGQDCGDGSDERYCQHYSDSCPSGFMKCSTESRRCLPSSALCDGFANCDNGFDETNCVTKINQTEIALLNNASGKAQQWILSSADGEFGWEDDTQRALVSLYLGDPETFKRKQDQHILLLAKQLELRFAWDLINNNTSPMSLFTMSWYVNALLATCKDPSSYHGIDLSQLLRLQTNTEEESTGFISPFVYLTLCIAGKSTQSDLNKMRDIFTSSDPKVDQIGLQSLAYLAISCMERLHTFPNTTVFRNESLTKLISKATNYGDVYSAALIFQAMTKANMTEKDWKRNNALDFIVRSQEENGSFGDLLATYYAMSIISGRPFETLRYGCNETQPDKPVTENETATALYKLNTNKSAGSDDFHPKVMQFEVDVQFTKEQSC